MCLRVNVNLKAMTVEELIGRRKVGDGPDLGAESVPYYRVS